MTALATAVAVALGTVASLLLYLFKTRWSQAAQWRERLGELEDAFQEADNAHSESLLGDDNDAVVRARAEWLRISEELARHRRAGQSAGLSG